ncbi:hypothetical protein ACHAWU_006820 [Discostella pseudostelligera]|uniref:C3H1-type domain-containing protein n=1 Tax=Discostella pseudostelligera TaxID=259834 RepID=A0ABD3MZD7_9STRA
MDDRGTLKRLYKRAKKAYKADKSNEDLKRAKDETKKVLMSVQVGRSGDDEDDNDDEDVSSAKMRTISSSTGDNVDHSAVIDRSDINDSSIDANNTEESKCGQERRGDGDGSDADDNTGNNSSDINKLEEAYQRALAAFKSNKTDKDLRRNKTAARRALDDAILAAASSSASNETTRQLTCTDCSKKFIYSMASTAQPKQRKRKGRKDDDSNKSLPTRCPTCHTTRINRLSTTQHARRIVLDSQKRNMCYAFQKGECPHGANCKFSHNPEHGGGKLPMKKQPAVTSGTEE